MARSIISLEIARLVVAINDRSYDQSWPPTIDRTIKSDLNPRNISTLGSKCNFFFYNVSEQSIGGRGLPPFVRWHDQF